MVMALGGRAAEEVVFHQVSSGAQNDMERVTGMAYNQVVAYGFSEAVGPLSFQSEDNTLYKPYSERTAVLIDSEAKAIVDRAYLRAIDMLTEKKAELTKLAEALLEKEVILKEDVIAVLGERPWPEDSPETLGLAGAGGSAAAAAVATPASDPCSSSSSSSARTFR